MEPYRTAGFRCPTCTGSPLREYHNRLICDECSGLQIDEPDFLASCADLSNQDLHLDLGAETQTKFACPRCERTMTSVRIRLAPLKVHFNVMRCANDGLWFQDGELTRVFASIGQLNRHHGRSYASGGTIGLDGLRDSLVISHWASRPRRRSPTATPINLYRDQRLACPACTTTELSFFGDRYGCAQCAGTFVQNTALEAMVMEISKKSWNLPPASGARGTRSCPVCSTPMIVEDLERVPIDRCAEHGVWFDLDELTTTLEHASHAFDPRGIRAWLKRLFT